jgi:hypothetical protein
MVLGAGVVIVTVGRFDVCVMLGVQALVGVCVGAVVTVGIDVDAFVRAAVAVGVESTVQVISNCGDLVVLFSCV